MPWYSAGSQPLDQASLPLDVVAGRIAQHDIRRQVLVLGAQRVADPRSQRRPAREDLAGLHHVDAFRVVVVLGVHRPDQAQLVGDRAQVRNDSPTCPCRTCPAS